MAKHNRNKAGRRTILTQELQDRICQLIRAGTYDYVAAEAAGISRQTFFDWLRRGEGRSERGAEPVYVKFGRSPPCAGRGSGVRRGHRQENGPEMVAQPDAS